MSGGTSCRGRRAGQGCGGDGDSRSFRLHRARPRPGRAYSYPRYVAEWSSVIAHHAEDNVVYDGRLKAPLSHWRIDTAFAPINGRDFFPTSRGIVGNTDFRETTELAGALNVRTMVPTRYDLFAFNGAQPRHFESRFCRLLRPSELCYYVGENA